MMTVAMAVARNMPGCYRKRGRVGPGTRRTEAYLHDESNCLGCQGAGAAAGNCQATRWRSSTLSASKSFCMQAVSATFLGLPASRRRS
jgi:hypothetical protein